MLLSITHTKKKHSSCTDMLTFFCSSWFSFIYCSCFSLNCSSKSVFSADVWPWLRNKKRVWQLCVWGILVQLAQCNGPQWPQIKFFIDFSKIEVVFGSKRKNAKNVKKNYPLRHFAKKVATRGLKPFSCVWYYGN